MITSKELSEYLKIHKNTITRLIKKGLPCYKVGWEYRFELEEVKQWLKEQAIKEGKNGF